MDKFTTVRFFSRDGEDVDMIERTKTKKKEIKVVSYEINDETINCFEAYKVYLCGKKKIVFFNSVNKRKKVPKGVIDSIVKKHFPGSCLLSNKELENSAELVILCN